MTALLRIFRLACRLSFALLVLLALFGAAVVIVVPRFAGDHSGCYWTDALFPFVSCREIPLAGIAEFVLNLPLFVFAYSWAFLSHSLATGKMLPWPLAAMCVAGVGLLALGALHPVWWLWNRLRRRNS